MSTSNLLKKQTSDIFHTYLYVGTPYIGKKGYRDYLTVAPDTSHLSSVCVYVTCDKNMLSALTPHERRMLIREGHYEKANIVYHCYPYKDEHIFYYVDNLSYIYYYIMGFSKDKSIYVNGKKRNRHPLERIGKSRIERVKRLMNGDIKTYEAMVLIPFDTMEWYYKALKIQRGKYFPYCGVLTFSSVHSSYSVLHPFGRKIPGDIKHIVAEQVKEHLKTYGSSKIISKSDILLRISDYVSELSDTMEKQYVKAMEYKRQGKEDLYEEAMQQHWIKRQQMDNFLNYLYNILLHQDVVMNLGKALLHYGSSHILSLYPRYNDYFYVNNVDHILSLGNEYGSNIHTKDILFHPIEEVIHSIAESVYQRYKYYKGKKVDADKYFFYNLYYNRFYLSVGYFLARNLVKSNKHNIKPFTMLPCLCVSTYNPRENKIYVLANKDIRHRYHIAESFVMEHNKQYYYKYTPKTSTTHH